MDDLSDGDNWRRALAVALLEGGADTDDVVRTVARALLATRKPAAGGRAPPWGGGLPGAGHAAEGPTQERILGLLGACAALEALECHAYNRPLTWPLLEQAVAAVAAMEAMLAAEGPAGWRRYATD